MPVEIHELEIVSEPSAPTPAAPASRPAPVAPGPHQQAQELRVLHRELAARAARLRAD